MPKATSLLLASLLFWGCTRSAEDVPSTSGQTPANAKAVESAARPATTASAPRAALADSPVHAGVLLAATLEAARASDKRIIVLLGAPWCGWCRSLEGFLDTNAPLFADDYIVLRIDIETMERGDEVAKQLRGARTGGIPWMAILDAEGAELATSDSPDGNIGCPVSKSECAYFVSMIERTIRHAPEERVADIAAALETFAAQMR